MAQCTKFKMLILCVISNLDMAKTNKNLRKMYHKLLDVCFGLVSFFIREEIGFSKMIYI